jgi:hypothetical protein
MRWPKAIQVGELRLYLPESYNREPKYELVLFGVGKMPAPSKGSPR